MSVSRGSVQTCGGILFVSIPECTYDLSGLYVFYDGKKGNIINLI